MTTETQPDLRDIEIVYMGRRMKTDGKVGGLWILVSAITPPPVVVDEDDRGEAAKWVGHAERLERRASVFELARGGTPVIGGIYQTKGEVVDDRVVRVIVPSASSALQGRYSGPGARELLTRWDLYDSAAYDRWRSHRQIRRLKADAPADRELAELSRLYRATPPADRMPLEMAILSRIRGAAR